MNTGKILFLVGMLSLFLLGGCSENENKTWEERQGTLLRQYLDRPGVSYGDIVMDPQKREWTIRDYKGTLRYDVYPEQEYAIRIQSITGTGVVLEPVSEVGTLAQKLTCEGLVMDYPGTRYEAAMDEVIIENFTGGPGAQKNMFGSEDGIIRYADYKDISFDIGARGIRVTDQQGAEVLALERTAMKKAGVKETGPVSLAGLVITVSVPGFESLSIDEVSLEKMTMANYDEFMALLLEKRLTSMGALMDPTVASEFIPFFHYDLDGLSAKGLSFLFRADLPPLTVKELRADLTFENGKISQAWHVDDLVIIPELLRALVPYHILGNYSFPAYTVSGDLDFVVQMDGTEIESVQLNTLSLREAALGGFSLKFSVGKYMSAMGMAPEGNKTPEPDKIPEPDKVPESGAHLEPDKVPETSPIPGDMAAGEGQAPHASGSAGPGVLENEAVAVGGLDYVKDVQLVISDKGLVKMGFGLASVLSGTVRAEDADAGGDMLRYGAAVAVSSQCERYGDTMKRTCLDTVRFLNKGGIIEYSFGFEEPLPLNLNPYAIEEDMAVTSKYTPLAE